MVVQSLNFSALIRGTERDPSLFTSVLNERASSTLKTTLDIASILSYACSDRCTVVPAGYVSVEGYLNFNCSAKVKAELCGDVCSIQISAASNGLLSLLDAEAATPTMFSSKLFIAKPLCPGKEIAFRIFPHNLIFHHLSSARS